MPVADSKIRKTINQHQFNSLTIVGRYFQVCASIRSPYCYSLLMYRVAGQILITIKHNFINMNIKPICLVPMDIPHKLNHRWMWTSITDYIPKIWWRDYLSTLQFDIITVRTRGAQHVYGCCCPTHLGSGLPLCRVNGQQLSALAWEPLHVTSFWMKIYEFLLRFHCSWFLRVQ